MVTYHGMLELFELCFKLMQGNTQDSPTPDTRAVLSGSSPPKHETADSDPYPTGFNRRIVQIVEIRGDWNSDSIP
jgi:hypothetical protein